MRRQQGDVSIDQILLAHPVDDATRLLAAQTVCRNATDADDARQLLDALGLTEVAR